MFPGLIMTNSAFKVFVVVKIMIRIFTCHERNKCLISFFENFFSIREDQCVVEKVLSYRQNDVIIECCELYFLSLPFPLCRL